MEAGGGALDRRQCPGRCAGPEAVGPKGRDVFRELVQSVGRPEAPAGRGVEFKCGKKAARCLGSFETIPKITILIFRNRDSVKGRNGCLGALGTKNSSRSELNVDEGLSCVWCDCEAGV